MSNRDRIVSADGRTTLIVQNDGNVVQYRDRGPVWDVRVNIGALGAPVTFDRADGLVSEDGRTYLAVQNDGNLVLYHGCDIVWNSGTSAKGSGPMPERAEGVRSADGSFELVAQDDDNVVLQGAGGPVWSTKGGDVRAAAPAPAPSSSTITRSQLGWPSQSGGTRRSPDSIVAVYVHHGESSTSDVSTWKGYRAYHLSKGWADIGYNYGVLADGTILEGRRVDVVPAAQAPYNTKGLAICLVGSGDSGSPHVTSAALRSIAQITLSVLPHRGSPITIKGHRDVNPTRCPGDLLYSKLPDIRAMVAAGW